MQQYMVTVERQWEITNFGFSCDDPITSSTADNWQPTAGDPHCTCEVTDQHDCISSLTSMKASFFHTLAINTAKLSTSKIPFISPLSLKLFFNRVKMSLSPFPGLCSVPSVLTAVSQRKQGREQNSRWCSPRKLWKTTDLYWAPMKE